MSVILEQLREQISAIDSELLALVDDRMKLSRKVAVYKKEHNLPIFDPEREAAMLRTYQEKVDFRVDEIFTAIMTESKRIQENILS